MQMIKTLI